MSILRRGMVPLILGVAIWIVPAPAGLTPSAWAYFALFVAVVTGLITEPLPGPVLTPHATGPAPIYFGSGYISRKEFWTLGLVFGLFYLVTLLALGLPYLWAIFP